MADVLLFHHAHGLTEGVRAFADDLRAAGHTVHTPDLFEGRTFEDVHDGVRHAGEELGFATVQARAAAAAEGLPADLVYAGFSLGSMPAQALAQQRPGARGLLLLSGGDVPVSEFGTWPEGLPAQVHVSEADEWVALDDVRAFLADAPSAELFVYPGSAHLFADRSLADYDEALARQLHERVLAFLS